MKFDHFLTLRREALVRAANSSGPAQKDPARVSSLALAYLGDALFALRTRERLLAIGVDKVRVLHTLSARMVSAPLQAGALAVIEPMFSVAEADVVRRGRNAATRAPRNLSAADYRSSTGFEALLGHLYIEGNQPRLDDLMEKAISWMLEQLLAEEKEGCST
jgi:ribonuclease-3 family protein